LVAPMHRFAFAKCKACTIAEERVHVMSGGSGVAKAESELRRDVQIADNHQDMANNERWRGTGNVNVSLAITAASPTTLHGIPRSLCHGKIHRFSRF
jgi:hypothetical protein